MILSATDAAKKFAPAIVIAVAAVLRLVAALNRPLYVDEGLSLSIGAQPLAQALSFLRSDYHPPAFFLLLHAVELLHAPIWLIRTSDALIGTASVGLLMLIVRTWSTKRAAVLAGAFAAIMPSLIFYDGWIRMYSLFDLLCLIGLLLISVIAVRPGSAVSSVALWTGWIASTVAALYTHYLEWMVLAAQLVFSATRRWPFVAYAVLCAIVSVIFWLPQLSTFQHQLGSGGISFGWFQSHLVLGLYELPSQASLDPEVEGWQAGIIAGVTLCWAIAALVFSWAQVRKTILPWLALPGVLTIAYSIVAHKYLYDARYFLLFGYALASWTGVALDSLHARVSTRRWLTLGSIAPVAIAASLYAFLPMFYTGDWPSVAKAIEQRAIPGDVLLFEPGAGNWAFAYYADERPYRIWQASTPQDVRRTAVGVLKEKRVWLIGSGIIGVDPNLQILSVLRSHFRLQYFEEDKRALPSQDLQVGLFVRN